MKKESVALVVFAAAAAVPWLMSKEQPSQPDPVLEIQVDHEEFMGWAKQADQRAEDSHKLVLRDLQGLRGEISGLRGVHEQVRINRELVDRLKTLKNDNQDAQMTPDPL